jgi:hypothetical protein
MKNAFPISLDQSCDEGWRAAPASPTSLLFRSRVFSVGPQLGYIFPIAGKQGFLDLKSYFEFDAKNRPEGWNTWLTFAISDAPPTASMAPTQMIHK